MTVPGKSGASHSAIRPAADGHVCKSGIYTRSAHWPAAAGPAAWERLSLRRAPPAVATPKWASFPWT